MGRNAKPWLNYKSDAPEREYFKAPKKKRKFGWALFWLIAGGHIGAHRLYLWDAKKAGLIILFYFVSFIAILVMSALLLPQFFEMSFETHERISIDLATFTPWFLIILLEFFKLRQRVDSTNKKYLLP